MPAEAPCERNQFLVKHATLLRDSFSARRGRELVEPDDDPIESARRLYQASFVVVSADPDPDPYFTYGNAAALELFEVTWDQLMAMRTRESAEPVHRDERARFLASVRERGHIDDYSGVRISRTGRRFMIQRATVWNVTDASGAFCGQAAMFSEWELISDA